MVTKYDPAYKELVSLLESEEIKSVDSAIREKLYKINDLFEKRHHYADDMTTRPSDILNEISKETFAHPWEEVFKAGKTAWLMNPRMMSGVVTVKFLQFVVRMLKAKKVLEIGMFTGYTALAMAEALHPDGVLHTCDVEEYLHQFVQPYFERSPHGKKIHVHIAPAQETLQKLADAGEQFDVIFIDADKPAYRTYVDKVLEKNLLAPNGIILADNAFKQGQAYTAPQTREENPINDFNTYVLSKPELEQALLPIRDGILAVRRKSEMEGEY